MEFYVLVSLLFSILATPQTTLGKIDNEGLNIAKYAYEQANESGINPAKFLRLLECESRLNKNAVGDKGKANGVAQFWQGTFDKFSGVYNLKGEYKNPYSQIDLASKMIADGLAGHWFTCATKAKFI